MKSYVPIFAFLLCIFLTIAQEIEGVVVSDTEDPLPGVNLVEKWTQNGVVTDFDGNFIIFSTAAQSQLLAM